MKLTFQLVAMNIMSNLLQAGRPNITGFFVEHLRLQMADTCYLCRAQIRGHLNHLSLKVHLMHDGNP